MNFKYRFKEAWMSLASPNYVEMKIKAWEAVEGGGWRLGSWLPQRRGFPGRRVVRPVRPRSLGTPRAGSPFPSRAEANPAADAAAVPAPPNSLRGRRSGSGLAAPPVPAAPALGVSVTATKGRNASLTAATYALWLWMSRVQ